MGWLNQVSAFADKVLPFDATPGFNLTDGSKTGGVPGVQLNGNPWADNHVLGAYAYNLPNNNNGSISTPPAPTAPSNTNTGAYQGSGISAAQAAEDAKQEAARRQGISIANAALGRLPGQLQTAQNNIRNTYDQNYNELESGRNAAQQDYNTSTTQNQQQLRTNVNQINDQASVGLRNLLRILGQHGAGGSSAAQFLAPDAVGQVASQQRSGANQNYGENQQSLDTNWNTYQTGYDNSKKKLADWLESQNNQAEINSENSRQSLLQQLASLQANPADAQPYIDRINSSIDAVDQLSKFNPTYTGKTPVYTPRDLSAYTVKAPDTPSLQFGGNNTSAATPALAYLLGLQKDRQQQPTF